MWVACTLAHTHTQIHNDSLSVRELCKDKHNSHTPPLCYLCNYTVSTQVKLYLTSFLWHLTNYKKGGMMCSPFNSLWITMPWCQEGKCIGATLEFMNA